MSSCGMACRTRTSARCSTRLGRCSSAATGSCDRSTSVDRAARAHWCDTMRSKERLAPALETEGGLDEASAAEPGRTSTLAALEFRDFRLFWFGLVVSNIGSWMQICGLGWLVVQLAIRDGAANLAPFYLGLVGIARAIPGVTFGLFGGAVADRADRRRLLIVTQVSAAIVAGILAALTITD